MYKIVDVDWKEGFYGCWFIWLILWGVEEIMEVRVVVVGNVDVGKSIILGVLMWGGLDDGRGKVRVVLFRYLYEVEIGRISFVGGEVSVFFLFFILWMLLIFCCNI